MISLSILLPRNNYINAAVNEYSEDAIANIEENIQEEKQISIISKNVTVGIVTKPFTFEHKVRMANAVAGIEKLKQNVDSLIVVPNDKLLEIVDRRTTMPDALKKADEVLQQAVQGITDLINLPALINLDFADVSTVMKDKGMAHIGIGSAKGDDKAIEAVKLAVASPLLETTINGASHVIINISGDISLMDANDAASYVQELAGDDVNIYFVDHNLDITCPNDKMFYAYILAKCEGEGNYNPKLLIEGGIFEFLHTQNRLYLLFFFQYLK